MAQDFEHENIRHGGPAGNSCVNICLVQKQIALELYLRSSSESSSQHRTTITAFRSEVTGHGSNRWNTNCGSDVSKDI
jgi:hypothetical protein